MTPAESWRRLHELAVKVCRERGITAKDLEEWAEQNEAAGGNKYEQPATVRDFD